MEKDYIINQLALSKAQLELSFLELQHRCQTLEDKVKELKIELEKRASKSEK